MSENVEVQEEKKEEVVPVPAPPKEPSKPVPQLDEEAPVMTMRALLEAGVHFGHQTNRWNPKMRPYIYGARNGIHVIDLQQTLPLFIKAYNAVVRAVANGHSVLFVGTKKQAQDVVREEAARCGMYCVTNRWLGGTLTNFATVKTSIEKLKGIDAKFADGTYDQLSKKEILGLTRQREKLERNLGGIKNMPGVPGICFIVDPRKERIAIAEARKLNIPVVAVADTNCDPDEVDYVIPGNDDAIRAIRLFAGKVADACMVGKRLGRDRAVAHKTTHVGGSEGSQEQIHVHSGGDGPKVEVVSRRSGPRPEPEAAAAPKEEEKQTPAE